MSRPARNAADRPEPLFSPRLIAAFAWLWLIAGIPFLTDAACNFMLELLLGVSGYTIGVVWVIFSWQRPALLLRPVRAWWLSVPVCGALGLTLLITDWDLALRVALCEDSLGEFVANVQPGAATDLTPHWVGLFYVEQVQEYQGGVYLFTSRSFLNRHGVAHIPPGVGVAPRMRVDHLYGPWYNFEWRF
jgi:hypothetical protein